MNRDVQRIIDDPRYAEVFPGTKLFGSNVRTVAQGSYLRNSDIFEIVGHKGAYRAAGLGGGITGMGAMYAIIDDPIKNRQDANSQTIRESTWEWYTSTLYTRLASNGRILVVLTRWHEDDLAGRLIERQKDELGDQWRVISFPAFSEDAQNRHPEDLRLEGAALWESRFNEKRLARIKAAMGSYNWAGLYQQRPAPAEGALFLRQWWRYYSEPPSALAPQMEELVQSWDMTFKDGTGNDYVVGQTWGRKRGDRYLLDQIRARMDFPATLRAVREFRKKWPKVTRILVEDKANGPAVISTLQREIQGKVAPMSRTKKAPRFDKVKDQRTPLRCAS
jgi:hypothetical protein